VRGSMINRTGCCNDPLNRSVELTKSSIISPNSKSCRATPLIPNFHCHNPRRTILMRKPDARNQCPGLRNILDASIAGGNSFRTNSLQGTKRFYQTARALWYLIERDSLRTGIRYPGSCSSCRCYDRRSPPPNPCRRRRMHHLPSRDIETACLRYLSRTHPSL
jgi:hypothetical protein